MSSSKRAANRKCSLPGCELDVAPASNGTTHDFCGKTHASRAAERCLDAVDEDHVERVFVGKQGWKLKLLERTHPDYEAVRGQFTDKWGKEGLQPTLERIFKVYVRQDVYDEHMTYRKSLAKKIVGGDINVVRRFHGTSSLCGVGINVGDSPCSSSECAVCGILTIGFDTNHAGSGAVGGQQRHLRYGKGIYSSATPGKANDYAAESERVHAGKKYRTQFVVSVAAGRVFKTRAGDLDLKTMPPLDSKGVSYDSVVGEVGYALNHDELVVYDDSAILPRFFIVYSLA